MTQEREAFEAWAKSRAHPFHDREPLLNGSIDRYSDIAWQAWNARASLAQPASVPDLYERLAEAHDASLDDDHRACRVILTEVMSLLAAAPQAPQPAQAVMVDMVPPATRRDRWFYEQGRLAERDPRTHALEAAPQPEAQPKGIPLDIPELQARLVAISAAVADQDDIAAQAMLGETLRMLDVTDAATIAGLESAAGHLSALVDEAQVLLTELREYARDLEKETLGGESERGEVSLLDRVDDWLDARPAAPSAQAEPQKPSLMCPKCGVDRLKAACPKGHSAALTGDCPMVAKAQAEQGGK